MSSSPSMVIDLPMRTCELLISLSLGWLLTCSIASSSILDPVFSQWRMRERTPMVSLDFAPDSGTQMIPRSHFGYLRFSVRKLPLYIPHPRGGKLNSVVNAFYSLLLPLLLAGLMAAMYVVWFCTFWNFLTHILFVGCFWHGS